MALASEKVKNKLLAGLHRSNAGEAFNLETAEFLKWNDITSIFFGTFHYDFRDNKMIT